MTKENLEALAAEYLAVSGENAFDGIAVFDEPLFGYCDAADPLFEKYRDPHIVGECFLPPTEWLPGARSVISIFFPFTAPVKKDNAADILSPSRLWIEALLKGRRLVKHVTVRLMEELAAKGFEAVSPAYDPRFEIYKEYNNYLQVTCSWSECHAAYICGLGTFSLTRGIITKKGITGRLVSIITSAPFEPSVRTYGGVDEYCLMCGTCAKRCPANAITVETGRDSKKCMDYVEEMRAKLGDSDYSCAKCMVAIPCQDKIPKRK